jgi:hypothetical protein
MSFHAEITIARTTHATRRHSSGRAFRYVGIGGHQRDFASDSLAAVARAEKERPPQAVRSHCSRSRSTPRPHQQRLPGL